VWGVVSIFKQPRAIAPILCGAGYAVFPFSSLAQSEGDGAPIGATVAFVHAPFPVRGASRRASAAFQSLVP